MERRFAADHQQFLRRREGVMERFHELQRVRQLVEEDEQEVNPGLEVHAHAVPIRNAVNNDGSCTVCSDRQPDTVPNCCGHIFCNGCIRRLEEERRRRYPICRARFHTHHPLGFNEVDAANIVLQLAQQCYHQDVGIKIHFILFLNISAFYQDLKKT